MASYTPLSGSDMNFMKLYLAEYPFTNSNVLSEEFPSITQHSIPANFCITILSKVLLIVFEALYVAMMIDNFICSMHLFLYPVEHCFSKSFRNPFFNLPDYFIP